MKNHYFALSLLASTMTLPLVAGGQPAARAELSPSAPAKNQTSTPKMFRYECIKEGQRSASHDTPINTNSASYPTLGIEGLLQLVSLIARLKADQLLPHQENSQCPNEMSPPARLSGLGKSVAESTSTQAPAISQYPQPDAGVSDRCSISAGGQ